MSIPDVDIKVSNHATKRCRQRLGVPKKAVYGLAARAYAYGTERKDISGSLRKYLDFLFYKEDSNANTIIVYNKYVFLFSNNILITAWILPKQYKAMHN